MIFGQLPVASIQECPLIKKYFYGLNWNLFVYLFINFDINLSLIHVCGLEIGHGAASNQNSNFAASIQERPLIESGY